MTGVVGGPNGRGLGSAAELYAALDCAAELEHALMCMYLFAALTLRRDSDDGIDAVAQQKALLLERELLQIAQEEMRHLATVWELQSQLGRDIRAQHAPWGLLEREFGGVLWNWDLRLAPLDAESARRLLRFETPAPPLVADVIGHDNDIGGLYRLIIDALPRFVPPDQLRAGDSGAYAGSWSRMTATPPMGSMDSAADALAAIIDDSESDGGRSHRARMAAIVAQVDGWDGVLSRPAVPVTGSRRGDLAARVAGLSDDAYNLMVASLIAIGVVASDRREAHRFVARRAMSGVFRPTVEVLTKLPAAAPANATAGPAFIVNRPRELAAQGTAVMAREIAELAERMDELAAQGLPRLAVVATTTRHWGERVAELDSVPS